MIGLVIVTHGGLAAEFRSALEHIVGRQQHLETIAIGPDDDMDVRRQDILKAVHLVNKDIRAALPLPVRVGIGIHSGSVILSQAEDNAGGQRMVVIGEAVVVASRLEEVTKEFAADCVISTRTITAAGLSPPSTPERPVHYKNGATPVLVHAFGDRQELRSLLGRTNAQTEPQPEPAAS